MILNILTWIPNVIKDSHKHFEVECDMKINYISCSHLLFGMLDIFYKKGVND